MAILVQMTVRILQALWPWAQSPGNRFRSDQAMGEVMQPFQGKSNFAVDG
jgi:hypothetical protein